MALDLLNRAGRGEHMEIMEFYSNLQSFSKFCGKNRHSHKYLNAETGSIW